MQPKNPFQNARWIGTDRFASPVIRREFSTFLKCFIRSFYTT